MSGSGSLTYLPYVLDAATCAIGSLLIYSGLKGTFVDPLAWAKGFGLPTATPENVVLFPSATGRNLGAGFFVWTMIILRERMVLGIFLMCWSWAGIADTKVLYAHPKGTNQAMHIRNTVIVLILGPLLIQSSQT